MSYGVDAISNNKQKGGAVKGRSDVAVSIEQSVFNKNVTKDKNSQYRGFLSGVHLFYIRWQ